ncbi:MAG TPA: site-specific DNA-methyltransferase, partial [Gammaproteobacteria bacterium]|nr:site-specific DNA-methyltransferase [Gammaproteobacteria bacterium]
MTNKDKIKIGKAKGRPMLTWVGKRPLTSAKAWPAQHIEAFAVDCPDSPAADDAADWSDWPENYPQGGLLFHGDNKDVLAHLLANGFRGKVKLIYIDPPFDSGADYVRKVQLRGGKGATKIDGEEYTLGEQIQYEDIWANDNYLQFMYERLLM